ncbi:MULTISPECIES: indolepyruvate ferredoxin oxidoreductase subunit alpha [Pyrobaculum]|uniref:Indolepyruvate oxidoreductase subunit IorA n=2 Tax=Pyrobaculum arsenaticum TaxID=121277 RepID=A4WLY2_PYRAR|nr:indolepyruvate ferredoxin oxidoreductase subunit alpha [Pyrobaculum arsenaticum]ABP51399.1 thiamine pyrophosphate enzyme domain protein TPP-binding protein [Pyrobaculum arsenaticum DSM 13514]NYR16231.1 indolepyruvate ferredoxin oxidoreductase subunit alpha [Pyrobaculum arsenaticum]
MKNLIFYIHLNTVKILLLGNEAIAYGALAGEVAVATAYPGTPSTEILETLEEFRDRFVHWATNEKTALEIAYGAAVAGARALVAMKHVGLNVAADPLHSAAYTGVEGGLVVVSADDPWMHSSQNEQDTRWYGLQAYVPVLEPSDPAEAYRYAKTAFELSEKLKHPIILRSVTRVSHVRAPVEVEPPSPPKWGRFSKDISRFNLVPAYARERRKALVEKWGTIGEVSAELMRVEPGGHVTIVTSGVAYNYVKEAVRLLNIDATIIKLGMPVPIPPKIRELVKGTVVVVEEGDPIVETQLRALRLETKGKIDGYFPKYGELNTRKVAEGIAKALDIPYNPPQPPKSPIEAPPRPPVLCPGCPHMGTFYILRLATAGLNPVWSGDIGCYSLGINTGQQDLITHMGSSVGLGMGVAVASKQFVVATVGDSTFYHAVLPQLIDLATKKVPLLVVVMDNAYTAMTGGQPSPSRLIPPEKIAETFGIPAFVIDPADIKTSIEVTKRAVEIVKSGRPVLVVSKRPCVLVATRKARKAGVAIPKYKVEPEKCIGCGICYNLLKCSAIQARPDRKAYIDPALCVGCGMCAEVCPVDAIKGDGARVKWLEVWQQA